jgi:glycosyltransferase involved in cell wall biosynthesis
MSASKNSPRWLVLSALWPEPRSSAAGARTHQVVDALLGAGCEVFFGATAPEAPPEAPPEDQARPSISGEARRELEARGVVTRRVEPNSPDFDEWLKELDPAGVIFDRFYLEEQFGWRVRACAPGAARLLDTSDLHFLRKKRQRQAQRWDLGRGGEPSWRVFAETSFPGRAVGAAGASAPKPDWDDPEAGTAALEASGAWRELAAIARCDRTWVLSHAEKRLLDSLGFGKGCEVVGLAGPKPLAPDVLPGFSERRDFVSIGNFRHPPNWDSVRLLHAELWPRLRALCPGAELHLYGAYPSREALRFDAPGAGLRVLGVTSDAVATLSRYRVLLAPLRFGAGVKGKILDAWAAGTPVVTTSIGAEGMEPFAGFVSDDRDAWLAAAAEVHGDPGAWTQASGAGADALVAGWARGAILPRIARSAFETAERLRELRAGDVLGQVLWFHGLRSTEYFSRWLETKRRLGSSGGTQ